jgi:hypothetical protein
MSKLIGTNPNQVPSNADLGTAAFMDAKEFLTSRGSRLSAIDAIVPKTAVDVFVYDTSKDSDGGAWRKRTQHTSWYNEKLSTTTRGSRKDFPAVAVLVAEANKLTIYDGDDPSLPMWMVFDPYGYKFIWNYTTSVAALNSRILLGGGSNTGLHSIDFIEDTGYFWTSLTEKYSKVRGNIQQRSISETAFDLISSTAGIVNATINDVDMTVLPNAPIDSATGLPVPTIAVATNGGVSVIKDDGTVVDITWSGGNAFHDIAISDTHKIIVGVDFSAAAGGRYVKVYDIPSSDLAEGNYGGINNALANYSTTSTIELNAHPSDDTYYHPRQYIGVNDVMYTGMSAGYLYTWAGLNMVHGYEDQSKAMLAQVTADYNTGWMNGDIKLATLSSTDAADVDGSELVTNGTFASNITGWTLREGNGTFSASSGVATLTYVSNPTSWVTSLSGITAGKTYTLSFNLVSASTSAVQFYYNHGTGSDLGVSMTSTAGTYSATFTAATSTVTIFPRIYQSGNMVIDNVSVRLAAEDRSVNGKGLQVFGTIKKTPVAAGADLVAYSGFSASNYLQQPYNSGLDFGTGDFSCSVWVNYSSVGNRCIYHRGSGSTGTWGAEIIQLETNSTNLSFNFSTNGFTTSYQVTTPVANLTPGVWKLINTVRRGNIFELWLDGVLMNSLTQAVDLSNTSAKLWIGERPNLSRPMVGSLSLMRWTATAPTPEQIKKIYKDEKVLFQENAKATLYGTSDGVTGFSYDDDTELLHAGTSAGRSVFQGLRRIDNTTDGVTTAISAVNGMVVEE